MCPPTKVGGNGVQNSYVISVVTRENADQVT